MSLTSGVTKNKIATTMHARSQEFLRAGHKCVALLNVIVKYQY